MKGGAGRGGGPTRAVGWALIHREIDGDLGGAGRAHLEAILRDDPELRAMRLAVLRAEQVLAAAPDDLPDDAVDRIVGSVAEATAREEGAAAIRDMPEDAVDRILRAVSAETDGGGGHAPFTGDGRRARPAGRLGSAGPAPAGVHSPRPARAAPPRPRLGAWLGAAVALAAAFALAVWLGRTARTAPGPSRSETDLSSRVPGFPPPPGPADGEVAAPPHAAVGPTGAPADRTVAELRTVHIRHHARGARSVGVAGPFNRWRPELAPLRPGPDGVWEGDLRLPAGRHVYVVVVDGERTELGEGVAEVVPDGFGGLNGVLEVR